MSHVPASRASVARSWIAFLNPLRWRFCGVGVASLRVLPHGGLVSREYVADPGDATVSITDHGESFEGEGRADVVSKEAFEAVEVTRYVAVDERDPDTRVYRKPAMLPGEHGGGGIGVEEPLPLEPGDYLTADLLGAPPSLDMPGFDHDVAHECLKHMGRDADIPAELFTEVAQRRNHVLLTDSPHAGPSARSLKFLELVPLRHRLISSALMSTAS